MSTTDLSPLGYAILGAVCLLIGVICLLIFRHNAAVVLFAIGLIAAAPMLFYWSLRGVPQATTTGDMIVLAILGVGTLFSLQVYMLRRFATAPGRAAVLPQETDAKIERVLKVLEDPKVRNHLRLMWHSHHTLISLGNPLWSCAVLATDSDIVRKEMALRARVHAQINETPVGYMLTITRGLTFPSSHLCEKPRVSVVHLPDDLRAHAGDGSFMPLADLLSLEGFPVRPSVTGRESDLFFMERQGTILLDGGELEINSGDEDIVPRTLVDREGRVIPLGVLEKGVPSPTGFVQVHPALYRGRIRRAQMESWGVLFGYRMAQLHIPSCLSILDTPPTMNEWPELCIAPDGTATLFVQRNETDERWKECVARLRELWLGALARTTFHLCAFAADENAIDEYMQAKRRILADYFDMHKPDLSWLGSKEVLP